jgi:hypothetical protein
VFSNNVVSRAVWATVFFASLGLCQCQEVRRVDSPVFTGITLVCPSQNSFQPLKLAVEDWIRVHGDSSTFSQVIATSSFDEARVSGQPFRGPLHDTEGFGRFIAAHLTSDRRGLLTTAPILRRLRVGGRAVYSFRSGDEKLEAGSLYRENVETVGLPGEDSAWLPDASYWFDYSPDLKLLSVFVVANGIPTCNLCKTVRSRLRTAGVAQPTMMHIRVRRIPWFNDDHFPLVFKFTEPKARLFERGSIGGLRLPFTEEYYLEPEVECQDSPDASPDSCVLSGRWSSGIPCESK